MKGLYLDIFSGISGDMFVGAMLDLGMGLDHLEGELGKLRLEGFHLHCSRAKRSQIEGVKFEVHCGHDHHHTHGHDPDPEKPHQHARSFADIRQLIGQSGLSEWVKTKATAVFHRLAVAEGKIHGLPPEQVHFHEVGALDSIVDIVGACVALEFFGKPPVVSSPVTDGTGWIDCAHGRFPVPAPATLEILAARGVSISQCAEAHELVTPTGAALLAEFAQSFGPMSNFAPERVGIGVGGRDLKSRPNVLRAVLGRGAAGAEHDWEIDTVAVLETHLDDASPELLGHFIDRVMAAGALDACHVPAQMKKNRPGVLLTVLCALEEADRFTEMMLRHTSAFGVRRTVAERRKLRRHFITARTAYGDVKVKIGLLDGSIVHTAPEFESCKKLAEEKNLPLRTIYDAALAAVKSDAQAQ
jgi:hypothetical protein